MAHLLDTNVLVRLANTADARHAEATRAVVELHRRREVPKPAVVSAGPGCAWSRA